MASDKGIGALIVIAAIVAAILYFGSLSSILPWSFITAVKIIVSAGFLVLLGIGGWIGYTMLTTPTPEAIDEEELEDIEGFEEEIEEEELSEEEEEKLTDRLVSIPGMTENRVESLMESGYDSLEAMKNASEDELSEVKGIGSTLAGRIKEELEE